jgi:ABC-type dipeptide/oligopeptide/nickel transport system permease subunit
MEVVVDRDRPGHNWSSGRGARCGFTLALIVVSFLIIIFLAFTFLADGLRDAFDPRGVG